MTNRLWQGTAVSALVALFAAAPSSTNYTLKAFEVGGSGGGGSSSNYKLDADAGTTTGAALTSTNYAIAPGELPTQHAFVPPAPTFTNPSNEYNRLRIVVNTGSNPSDTRYAIAISDDGFASTQYVQTDNTVSSAFSITNYQSYSAWGSGSGVWITGLTPGVTYTVKVAAYQGDYTNSKFGPTASAATVQPSLTFSLETTLTATPPYSMAFSSISPGSVTSANADAIATLSTNALSGGKVYVQGANTGLASTAASYTLTSTTADLASVAFGYGAQVISTSQSSGGPVSALSPFSGAGDNVGAITSSLQEIVSTTAPVTSGVATVRLKAKTDTTIPSATDYSDTLTFVAAMQF